MSAICYSVLRYCYERTKFHFCAQLYINHSVNDLIYFTIAISGGAQMLHSDINYPQILYTSAGCIIYPGNNYCLPDATA